MNRLIYYVEITSLSGVLALFKSLFGTINISYIVLLILIALDTFTGMSVALKYHRFSSKGLCKLLKKIITYSMAILTIRLLEVGILTIVETIFISQVVVTFLQVTETVSILENLTLLGVPLPANFINFLIKHIKIPGLSDAIRLGRNEQKDLTEIDDIINYQIPTFEDKNVRELLKIKFNFWRTIAFNIRTIFDDNNNTSSEHIYYKFMSLMEIELKDMNKELKNADIPNEYLEKFEKNYRPQVDSFLQYMKGVCNSEKNNDEIKDDIINKIVVLSYETILKTHKIFNGNS
ncbi:phage holin family protein [Sporosalibacterium faouarense]|uniref:phage holin family protein n=1 Tax=Sporosalibacterium faouarense TaxID=516123 RepID=UPI00141C8BD9|nr:phage holin family protein [Sporosalibacterium faouarense]MTI46606.1 phage holin family protein [Bacillota bacterium]